MTHGKPVPDELRKVTVQMAHIVSVNNICALTRSKKRTVQRILADFRRTGSALRSRSIHRLIRGRARKLTHGDIRVKSLSSHIHAFI